MLVKCFLNEKNLKISNQKIEGYEDYIDDNQNKSELLDKSYGDNIEETCSEKKLIYKSISNNLFIESFK